PSPLRPRRRRNSRSGGPGRTREAGRRVGTGSTTETQGQVGQSVAQLGVGPSPVAQLMRDRSLRLAAALAVAIAIPVALLFYFQFRAIEDLGRSSTVVLQQLSQETAVTLHKDIEDSLKSPYINVLIRITQV